MRCRSFSYVVEPGKQNMTRMVVEKGRKSLIIIVAKSSRSWRLQVFQV
jgi:hypothetical protein